MSLHSQQTKEKRIEFEVEDLRTGHPRHGQPSGEGEEMEEQKKTMAEKKANGMGMRMEYGLCIAAQIDHHRIQEGCNAEIGNASKC